MHCRASSPGTSGPDHVASNKGRQQGQPINCRLLGQGVRQTALSKASSGPEAQSAKGLGGAQPLHHAKTKGGSRPEPA